MREWPTERKKIICEPGVGRNVAEKEVTYNVPIVTCTAKKCQASISEKDRRTVARVLRDADNGSKDWSEWP